MSQAGQVSEDMPAYLNDEPVTTGKHSTLNIFLLMQSVFTLRCTVQCSACVEYEVIIDDPRYNSV